MELGSLGGLRRLGGGLGGVRAGVRRDRVGFGGRQGLGHGVGDIPGVGQNQDAATDFGPSRQAVHGLHGEAPVRRQDGVGGGDAPDVVALELGQTRVGFDTGAARPDADRSGGQDQGGTLGPGAVAEGVRPSLGGGKEDVRSWGFRLGCHGTGTSIGCVRGDAGQRGKRSPQFLQCRLELRCGEDVHLGGGSSDGGEQGENTPVRSMGVHRNLL